MKEKLYCNKNIDFHYHTDSNKHEVVAVEDIKKGEIIEEAVIMVDSTNMQSFQIETYKWPKGSDYPICDVFVHGFGTFFRRTNLLEESNVNWESDLTYNLIIFTANRDIKQGEFLTVYDPDNWRYYKQVVVENNKKSNVKKNIRTFLDKIKEEY